VIDDQGAIVKRWMVEHTDNALGKLFAELATIADARGMPIAIERGEGLVALRTRVVDPDR
jgi:hypothetical protein